MTRLAGVAAGRARRADLRAALALVASRARSASRSRSACLVFASWVVMVYMTFSLKVTAASAGGRSHQRRTGSRQMDNPREIVFAAGLRRGRQRCPVLGALRQASAVTCPALDGAADLASGDATCPRAEWLPWRG
jgi:hypothetical protein